MTSIQTYRVEVCVIIGPNAAMHYVLMLLCCYPYHYWISFVNARCANFESIKFTSVCYTLLNTNIINGVQHIN